MLWFPFPAITVTWRLIASKGKGIMSQPTQSLCSVISTSKRPDRLSWLWCRSFFKEILIYPKIVPTLLTLIANHSAFADHCACLYLIYLTNVVPLLEHVPLPVAPVGRRDADALTSYVGIFVMLQLTIELWILISAWLVMRSRCFIFWT